MPQTLDVPQDWEHFLVFPAHRVVHAPLPLRMPLHALGAHLYREMAARNGGPADASVREQLEALFTELCQVRDVCMGRPAFKAAARLLVRLLARHGRRFRGVLGALPRGFRREGLPFQIRPFVWNRLGWDRLEVIRTFGESLDAVLTHEPSDAELASALVFDLRWVRTVLEQRLSAGATADPHDGPLTALAADLAADFDPPIHELIRRGGLEWL